MKNKFLLVLLLLCSPVLASDALAPARRAPTAEELHYLAAVNRLYAVQFGRFSEASAAYYNGRADAYADIAAQLEGGAR